MTCETPWTPLLCHSLGCCSVLLGLGEHYTLLHYNKLNNATLHYTTLYSTPLLYTTLHSTKVQYSIVRLLKVTSERRMYQSKYKIND